MRDATDLTLKVPFPVLAFSDNGIILDTNSPSKYLGFPYPSLLTCYHDRARPLSSEPLTLSYALPSLSPRPGSCPGLPMLQAANADGCNSLFNGSPLGLLVPVYPHGMPESLRGLPFAGEHRAASSGRPARSATTRPHCSVLAFHPTFMDPQTAIPMSLSMLDCLHRIHLRFLVKPVRCDSSGCLPRGFH